jgi:hypothetical protein
VRDTRITFKAYPTIERFLRSDAFIRCLVGPVGSGKSSACVMEVLLRAAAQRPGPDGKRRTRFAIIRNTYGQLRDTTRKTFEQWVPLKLGTWHEQSFTFHIKAGDWDSEVLFRALDRPEDIKKLLSLELTGAYINEAREIPKHVLDILQTRVGRYPSVAQGGATWFGIWMDTNPWHTGHWGYQLFKKTRPSGYELFEQPGGRTPQAENIHHLPTEYYSRLVAGKDSEWIHSYVDGGYPSSDVGSIWGPQVAALEARLGIGDFAHPFDGVFTSWDLGVSDSTAIWFWRINADGMPDLIDHYEASGQEMSHYFHEVDTRPYIYTKHWLPHDARQRSWQTGVGILDQFIAHYGGEKVAIGPEMTLRDGIQAGRWLLEQPMRIHSRCEQGIEALREYRYEYDEDLRVFSTRPLHNWASHSADAFRYLALVAKFTETITRKKPPQVSQPAVPMSGSFSLDQLFKDKERRRI